MKAVIFDLDGLLVNTELISYEIYQKIIGEYGYEMTMKDYADEYAGKLEEDNLNKLIRTYNLKIELDEGLDLVKKMEDEFFEKSVDLFDGVHEILAYLKHFNYKVGLATSSFEFRARKLLKSHSLETYFDAMTFGNEITKGKPSPEIFLKTVEKLGVRPEDSLVLEDSEAGIIAAHRGKMPVICIPDLKVPSDEVLALTEMKAKSHFEVINYIAKKDF